MLISRHDCISILMKQNDIRADELLHYLINNQDICITKDICDYLIEHNIEVPVIEHYKLLNNKAHKVIKEVLESDGKDIATYIKIATSLITQATITLEHKFNGDDKENRRAANKFIENTLLSELSQALYIYFNYNDYTELVNTVKKVKDDIKLILD